MNKIKIIHGADFHFDTPFKELPASMAEKRNEDIKKSFESLIRKVKEESVQILLLCGDIFDNKCIKKSTLEFLRSKLESINETRVFIAAGNHDPLNDRSFYKILEWPNNVHIFSTEIESIVIEELKTVVYGRSFGSNYEHESLLNGFKIPLEYKKYINIMALHGDISSAEKGNEYNPLTIEEIRKSQLDYLALGHRHAFSDIKREGETFYAYSGCPEGRGFDELGDKGIIIGDIYKGHHKLQFQSLCQRTYNVKEIDLMGLSSQEEIINKIYVDLKREDTRNNFYKIILKGEFKDEIIINMKTLHYRLKDEFYFLKIKDQTSLAIDYESLRNENSLRGILLSKMYKKLEEENIEKKEIVERALKLAFNALREEEVNLDDY